MSTVAIILNYNDASATVACVESLLPQPEVEHVLVVDNGSCPCDMHVLQAGTERYPNSISLIVNDRNAGFGAGINLGIEKALASDFDSILVLNNDTEVRSGAVGQLREALFSDDAVGVCLPVITTGDAGEIWAAGGWLDRSTYAVTPYTTPSKETLDPLLPINFVPGAAFLARPEVFRQLGGFAEGFFLYLEDVEFSMRITEAGFKIALAPGAEVWHRVQGGDRARTFSSIYYRVRNGLWLVRSRSRGFETVGPFLTVLMRGLRLVAQKAGSDPEALAGALSHYARGARDGVLQREPHTLLKPAPVTAEQTCSGETLP